MDASDVLARLVAAGLKPAPVPPGQLAIVPRNGITDELRALSSDNKATLLAHPVPRERMAEQAAEKLRRQPELRRAAVLAEDGVERCLAAVAVRTPDGGIATAVVAGIRVDNGPLPLLQALDRACGRSGAVDVPAPFEGIG